MPFLVAVDENDIGEGNLQIKPGTSNVLEPYGKVYRFDKAKSQKIVNGNVMAEIDASSDDMESIIEDAKNGNRPILELALQYNPDSEEGLEQSVHFLLSLDLRRGNGLFKRLMWTIPNVITSIENNLNVTFGDSLYVFIYPFVFNNAASLCYLDIESRRLYYFSVQRPGFLLPYPSEDTPQPTTKEGT